MASTPDGATDAPPILRSKSGRESMSLIRRRALDETINRMEQHMVKRDKERRAVFSAVAARAGLVVAAGLIITVVSIALGGVLTIIPRAVELILAGLGNFMQGCGVILLCTLPPQLFHMDDAFDRWQGPRRITLVAILAFCAIFGVYAPYVMLLAGVIALTNLVVTEISIGCCSSLHRRRYCAPNRRGFVVGRMSDSLSLVLGLFSLDKSLYLALMGLCHASQAIVRPLANGEQFSLHDIPPTTSDAAHGLLNVTTSRAERNLTNCTTYSGPSDAAISEAEKATFFYIGSGISAIGPAIVFFFCMPMRLRHMANRAYGWNPTLSFFNVIHVVYISVGLEYIYRGSWAWAQLGVIEGVGYIICGIGTALPYVAALLWGRRRLFGVMKRQFESKQRGIDGAFLAALMDGDDLLIGQEIWVHHGKNDTARYPDPFDHRANWQRGFVADIRGAQYRFEAVPNPGHLNKADAGLSAADTASFAFQGTARKRRASALKAGVWHSDRVLQTNEAKQERRRVSLSHAKRRASSNLNNLKAGSIKAGGSVRKLTLKVASKTRRLSGIVTPSGAAPLAAPPRSVWHAIPGAKALLVKDRSQRSFARPRRGNGGDEDGDKNGDGGGRGSQLQGSDGGGRSSQLQRSDTTKAFFLLKSAKKELRVLDGADLTKAVMRQSTRDEAANAVKPRRLPADSKEKINFFLSHSWHDDPDAKWNAIETVKNEYKRMSGGREATFWLDKVCIDQENIGDGLRVLCINVTACDKLLMLCGKTYMNRLWCVLELFMVFAFADEETALSRVVLVPIEEEGVTRASILDSLANFRLEDANCFDPNEELKLRMVMQAIGEKEFVERIRSLADLIRKDDGKAVSLGRRLKSMTSFTARKSSSGSKTRLSLRTAQEEGNQDEATDASGSEPAKEDASDVASEAARGASVVPGMVPVSSGMVPEIV